MSLDAFRQELGFPEGAAEERGKVIVLAPDDSVVLDRQARRRIVAAARAHGYSNVCVELAPLDANLPGD
jgi:hypothetical protein